MTDTLETTAVPAGQVATGTIFNVQRFSTEDGPGIRTTVFMKGCPLRCRWCHNPEGLSSQPQLMWYDVRCIGSRACVAACSKEALELTPEGMRIDRARCAPCDACSEACPAGALEIIGKRWTPQDLFELVAKDAAFYETSGGGVTVSGGEPAMQPAFVEAFLALCREGGIATAIDTCGHADWSLYERLLPHVGLVLFDLKIADRKRHRDATGVYPDRIFENAAAIAKQGIPMWVRTPIIPGYTDDEGNVAALGALIVRRMPVVERWDLLAYTNLGRPKYHRLDLPYALEEAGLLPRERMEQLARVASRQGVKNVVWSGATRD